MTHLMRTTAIAAALGAFTFGAQAQTNSGSQDMAASSAGQNGSSQVSVTCDNRFGLVDTDGNGFISQSEAESHMDAEFGAIDQDGNDQISRTEYADCFVRTAEEMAAESDRSADNFASADANSDQSIDRDEFRQSAEQAYGDTRSGDGQQASADDENFVVLRRYVWLTPQEAESGQAMQDMSADEAAARSAQTFASLDTNDDGMVDQNEWTNRAPANAADQDWADARFDDLDDDGNDSVNRDEYRSARSDMLDETTTASTTGDSQDASSGDAAQSGSTGEGTPVFLYRFLTY